MTKEQVWKAYEEMDRLDSELNGLASDASADSSPRVAVNGPKQMKAVNQSMANQSMASNSSQFEFNSNSQSVHEYCAKTVASFSRNGSQVPPQHNSHPQTSHPDASADRSSQPLPAIGQTFGLPVPQLDMSDSSGEESVAKESSVTITPIAGSHTDSNHSNHSNAMVVSHSHNRPMSTYYGGEEPQELVEFKKKGDSVMLNEIRSFVTKYNIRQIMIAEMTKISQGYVSRFFRGEGHDMSDKSKNLIYLWYLSCRQRPEILAQYCPQTIGERRTLLSEAGDLLPIRRDRFIFRKEHLMILDKYFKENPYPDASTKEMIAEECNEYVEQSTGRLLKERDKVSISVVSNWFNNKRKEVKTRRSALNNELTDSFGDHSMHSQLFSNNSDCSVEELETRPDLTILTDFDRQDSIELSDEADIEHMPSQQNYQRDQMDQNTNNYLKNHQNHEMNIKLEPSY